MNLEYLEKLYLKPIKSLGDTKEADTEAADRYLNIAYKEVFLAHSWIYRKRSGQITIIPRYTTGTCTVVAFDGTNEASSKTVTFSGATLTQFMVGRYFRVSGSDIWHKIMNVTGSTAYLDSPVISVNGSGKTFEIWKRFYYVKSDVSEILDFGRWSNGRLEYNPDLLDRYTDISKESNTPSSFNAYGIDPFDDIDSTGTLTIDVNSNVAVGSGTTWLSDGYDTGDLLKVGQDFYIKRIETNTRAILFNYVSDPINSISFTLKKNNPIGFEFYNSSDAYHVLPYDYLGRAYDLVHKTKDRILLPSNFIPAIVSRAQYYGMKDSNDTRYTTMLSIYNAELTVLKEKVQIVKSRYVQFSPKIHSLAPGRS